MSYLGWESSGEFEQKWTDYGNWVGGVQERVQDAREERVRAALRAEQAKLRGPEREFTPLATGPVSSASAFELNPPRRSRRNARGKAIDALIEKHVGRRR
jgi:hypothetical protein